MKLFVAPYLRIIVRLEAKDTREKMNKMKIFDLLTKVEAIIASSTALSSSGVRKNIAAKIPTEMVHTVESFAREL